MAKAMLDAVKTAKSIHEGDYSSLRGKSFLICDKIKNNKGRSKQVKKHKSKYTLNQLGMTVDQLGMTVDKLGMTVDKLVVTVDKLTKYVIEGFRQVNARIDRIDTRLDYIVQANNLKDLPKKDR